MARSSVRAMWGPDWWEEEVEERRSGWTEEELWWEESGAPWLVPGTGPGWLCVAAPARNVKLLFNSQFEWQQRASWLGRAPPQYFTINNLITLIEPLWYKISIFNIRFENLIQIVKNKRYLSKLSALPIESCLMFVKSIISLWQTMVNHWYLVNSPAGVLQIQNDYLPLVSKLNFCHIHLQFSD